MAFDFLDVTETVVAEGLEGKQIMVYGSNNLGKSLEAAKFPKPVFFPIEKGLGAIGGAKTLKVNDWASFKDFTNTMVREKNTYERMLKSSEEKDMTKSKFYQFKQMFETIVVDTLDALGKSCEKYVVDSADVQELSEIGHGKLYKRFENEFYRTVIEFINLGFTVLWIGHPEVRTIDEEEGITKIYPKGDKKRVVQPVIDSCDIVAYLQSNGIDENGKVIKSSAYLAETEDYFARTKWDNMVTYIEEFSAENLQKALIDAINEQKENGVNVGTYSEQQKAIQSAKLDYKEIKSEIEELVEKIYEHDNEDVDGENMTRYFDIVKEYLGDGMNVKDSKPKQVQQLSLILSEVRNLIVELEL